MAGIRSVSVRGTTARKGSVPGTAQFGHVSRMQYPFYFRIHGQALQTPRSLYEYRNVPTGMDVLLSTPFLRACLSDASMGL
ncbi:hypothetical protein ABH899_001965 [Paenibacillus sp. RC84]